MSSITEKIIFGIHFVVSVSRPHNGVIRDDSDDKMKQFALTWYSGFVSRPFLRPDLQGVSVLVEFRVEDSEQPEGV